MFLNIYEIVKYTHPNVVACNIPLLEGYVLNYVLSNSIGFETIPIVVRCGTTLKGEVLKESIFEDVVCGDTIQIDRDKILNVSHQGNFIYNLIQYDYEYLNSLYNDYINKDKAENKDSDIIGVIVNGTYNTQGIIMDGIVYNELIAFESFGSNKEEALKLLKTKIINKFGFVDSARINIIRNENVHYHCHLEDTISDF